MLIHARPFSKLGKGTALAVFASISMLIWPGPVPAYASPGDTEWISVDAEGSSHYPTVSDDGTIVAFSAEAEHGTDLFVTDRTSGTTTRVGGLIGNGYPGMSGDGRFVTFITGESLAPGDTFGDDVYLFDRQAGSTRWVSVNGNGQGGHQSEPPVVSADGRFVAFSTITGDLVEGDTNGRGDVFVRDMTTNTTVAVSVSNQGAIGNAPSGDPAMSADGRYVAFSSLANNLVQGDTDSESDVFVRDLTNGTTTLVSAGVGSPTDGHGGTGPSISDDGRYVAWSAYPNGELYVRDRTTSTTRQVDLGGIIGTDEAFLSGDGHFVAFEGATLLADGSYAADIFVHDLVLGTTTPIGLMDTETGNAGGGGFDFSITAHGNEVAFMSVLSLAAGDTDGRPDVYIREVSTTPMCDGRIATILGTVGADSITGTPQADVIAAGYGNDVIDAGAGNDTVCGGPDGDVVRPGTGNDKVLGDAGLDTVSYSTAALGVAVDLAAGSSTGAGSDLLVGVENATGSPFNDTLRGSVVANVLQGLNGWDVLSGFDGGDRLDGGNGNDRLYGHTGADNLSGMAGNDLLSGGAGNDSLDGGSGIDTCGQDAGSGPVVGCE